MTTFIRRIFGNTRPTPTPAPQAAPMPTFGPWATHSPTCKNPCCN